MIEGIDHIGIAVESIDRAKVFYEHLGLAVEEIEEVPLELVRVAMIPCGISRIELIEPTSQESPIARYLARKGPGLHHICLKSGDVVGDDGKLRQAGLELLRPEPTRGAGGALVQFVHPKSAGGVLVELSEPAATRTHRR